MNNLGVNIDEALATATKVARTDCAGCPGLICLLSRWKPRGAMVLQGAVWEGVTTILGMGLRHRR